MKNFLEKLKNKQEKTPIRPTPEQFRFLENFPHVNYKNLDDLYANLLNMKSLGINEFEEHGSKYHADDLIKVIARIKNRVGGSLEGGKLSLEQVNGLVSEVPEVLNLRIIVAKILRELLPQDSTVSEENMLTEVFDNEKIRRMIEEKEGSKSKR